MTPEPISQIPLWILCGLPYSGKTYIAKKILEKTSCVYVSIDEILDELGYDWNSNKLPDKEGWQKVFDISYSRSQDALSAESNVLYDSTNHTRASRDVLRKIAGDINANSKFIYIDAPVELVRKRWEQNKATKDRFILDERLLDMTIDAFEAPSKDENALVIKKF